MENTPPSTDGRQLLPSTDQIAPRPDSPTEPSAPASDMPPNPDDYDTLERRRFGPMGVIPSSLWLTIALCLAFVGLLVYGVVSGNALAFALVAVVAIFVGVPYLLLFLLNGRRLPPRSFAPPVEDGEQWRPDDEMIDYPEDESVPDATREPIAGAAPAAGPGEPNVGNGHNNGAHG